MRAFAFALTASLFVPPSILSAQQPPPLEPGARVRVTAPDCGIDEQAGTLQPSRGDTLVLADGTRCLRSNVARFEVSQGRKSNVGKGIGYGALVGGVVGSIVAASDQASCTSWCVTEGSVAFIGAIIFAVPGAFVGGIVGAFVKTERWEEVPLDRLRVSFAPQRDGRFVLMMSVGF